MEKKVFILIPINDSSNSMAETLKVHTPHGLPAAKAKGMKAFAAASLAAASLLSPSCKSCGRESPERLSWTAGYIAEVGTVRGVSLGFLPGSLPYRYPDFVIITDENKEALQSALDLSSLFFRPEVIQPILTNAVFLPFAGDSGLAGEYSRGISGLKIVRGGQELSCLLGCPDYAWVRFEAGRESVVFHEFLHAAYATYFNDQERAVFSAKARLFFNLGGNDWRTDEILGAIRNGRMHRDPNDLTKTISLGIPADILHAWAQIELPSRGLDGSAIAHIETALTEYLSIRTILFGATFHKPPSERDAFVIIEGFAYTGTNNYDGLGEYYSDSRPPDQKHIPALLREIYAKIFRPDSLEVLVNYGGGYFIDEQTLKAFEPYLLSFMDFAKKRIPLDKIGEY